MVGVGLVLMSLISAGQAILIAFLVEDAAATDAFFAAYAIYAPLAAFGLSLRTGLVSLLGSPEPAEPFRRRASEQASRVALLGLVLPAIVIAASWPLAGALASGAGPDEHRLAWSTLVLLMPAAALQIAAGGVAAALNSARRFSVSIGFYVGAGTLAVAISAVLLPIVGVTGAALGLILGAITLATLHASYAARFGVALRPRLRWLAERRQWGLASRLAAGVALPASQQIALAIALASLSAGTGDVTLYAYAFYITGVLLNLSVIPMTMVTLPDLVSELSTRGAAAARTYMRTVAPYVAAILVPALAGFAVFGEPFVQLVFGPALGDPSARALQETASLLTLVMLFAAASTMAAVVLVAQRRWATALLVAGGCILVYGVAFGALGGDPEKTAAVHAATTAVAAALLLAAAFGRQAPAVLSDFARGCWRAPLFSAVFPIVRFALGWDLPNLALVLALCGATLIYAGLVLWLWPEVGRRFTAIASGRGRAYAGSGPGDVSSAQ